MFAKGFLSASRSLITLLPTIPQHKLDQTKEHVLCQYKKQQVKTNKNLKNHCLNQTQEVHYVVKSSRYIYHKTVKTKKC